MTFSTQETSRQSGQPISLYLFQGAGAGVSGRFAYTNAEHEIVHDGVTYQPIPIQRGRITASGGLDKSSMAVSVPHSTGIAELFKFGTPAFVVNLTVWDGHIDLDPDTAYAVVWVGRARSGSVEGSEAEIDCQPVSTLMRRNGLRRNYQIGCPHILYGDQCAASKAAATVTTTVSTKTGNQITLPGGWTAAQAKFAGGMAEWTDGDGVVRTARILSASGVTVTLSGNLVDLAPTVTIKLSKGCNHQMDDCESVHANINNYGGQPYIPVANPLKFVNIFG